MALAFNIMKHIFFLLLFLCPFLLNASWSGFAVITPESEQKYNVHIKISKVDNQPNALKISIPVFNPQKHSWLIICKNKLTQKQLDFRNYIWFSNVDSRSIVLKARLRMKENLLYGSGGLAKDKFIEIILDKDIMDRSYIYIDFPSVVKDGGYYYTIDLSKYSN